MRRTLYLIGALLLAHVVLLTVHPSGATVADRSDGLDIGIVFDVGGRGDKSFNDGAYLGGMRAAKALGARVRYIEGDMTAIERGDWLLNFGAEPPPLTDGDKAAWLAKLSGVALASDAFFPFRDSLDHAAKYGVQFVAQPGGSVQDAEVTKAAEAYGMTMAHNKLRLFHH